jgi:hypothetical protein
MFSYKFLTVLTYAALIAFIANSPTIYMSGGALS